MEDTINKVAQVVQAQPPEVLNDKDGILAKCIVNLIHEFSSINKLTIATRGKVPTPAKQEEAGSRLSKAIFFSCAIVHILDEAPEDFTMEDITAFSDGFHPDYLQDVILASNFAIQAGIDIMEGYFGMPEDGGPGEDDEDFQQSLAEILAVTMILAERFDLDYAAVLDNALHYGKL